MENKSISSLRVHPSSSNALEKIIPLSLDWTDLHFHWLLAINSDETADGMSLIRSSELHNNKICRYIYVKKIVDPINID